MPISPYTMDVLYRNGSIDYIPYELMAPVQYPNKPVNYQLQSPSVALNSLGMASDYYDAQGVNGVNGVNEYRNLAQEHPELNKSPYTKKTILKGLASLGILVGTTFLLIKGGKALKFDTTKIKAFFSKLNPVKWFKK